jgi:tRNA(Ile)-lysidine synthase
MADAADLKSAGLIPVWVRLPPALFVNRSNARLMWSGRFFLSEQPKLRAMNKTWAKWLLATLSEAGYQQGDRLVVGVSGGPDSLALLHMLRGLFNGAALHATHLDHGIRPSSAGEAKFVAELAGSWGIPFLVKRVDVPDLAAHRGWSLEEAARNARYEFLAETAQEVGAQIVAVGHNSDDQAETILMHFLRGSGVTGLRGMLPVSPYPGDSKLKLLRPLLHQSSAEIEAYCQKYDLNPIEDESNRDPAYLRNQIRHQLLPELAGYNPQIKNHLVQLGEIVTAEDDVVGSLFEDIWPELIVQTGPGWLSLDRGRFRNLPLALQRRAVRRAVETLYPDVSDLAFKTVEQVLKLALKQDSGMEARLSGDLTMLVDYETLLFARKSAEIPLDLPQMLTKEAVQLLVPGQVRLGDGWILAAELVETAAADSHRQQDPWTAVIDLPLGESLFVRPRKPGERMQPLGMDGRSASLQDIMVNRKIAGRLREKWPLVASDEHVVWLTGHIIDHRVRISDKSQRVIRLTCKRKSEAS